jgi:hypothetical protein
LQHSTDDDSTSNARTPSVDSLPISFRSRSEYFSDIHFWLRKFYARLINQEELHYTYRTGKLPAGNCPSLNAGRKN